MQLTIEDDGPNDAADTTPGTARIEVALPTNTQTLREEVIIEIVEATAVEAIAFPQQVARLKPDEEVSLQNTATILVPIRDGDGDLAIGVRRRVEPVRQQKMQEQLSRIAAHEQLSKDVSEIVERALHA